MQIKCNFFKCGKELSVEKREVFALSFGPAGHRFCCKEHYDFVISNKIKPTLKLIYGEKKYDRPRTNHFKPKRGNPFKSRANVSGVQVPAGQSESKVPDSKRD